MRNAKLINIIEIHYIWMSVLTALIYVLKVVTNMKKSTKMNKERLMKYAVYRATNLVCCTVVEAESEEEAVNKAYGASYTVNSSECFVRNVVEKKEEGIRTYEIYGSTDVMCKAVEERV